MDTEKESTAPNKGRRFPGSTLLVAAVAAVGIVIGWDFILSLNRRLSPHTPWYPVGALLVITTVWAVLRPRWMPRGLVSRTRVDARLATCILSGTIAAAALTLFLITFSPVPITGATRKGFAGTGLERSYVIVAPLFAAVAEEILFRGVIQPALERYVGIARAILITSVLFALAHAANPLFATQWPFYFFCSVFFGFVAWRTESMLWPIGAHVMINLVTNLLVLRYVVLDHDTLQGGPAVGLLGVVVLGMSITVWVDRRAVLEKYSRATRESGFGHRLS